MQLDLKWNNCHTNLNFKYIYDHKTNIHYRLTIEIVKK